MFGHMKLSSNQKHNQMMSEKTQKIPASNSQLQKPDFFGLVTSLISTLPERSQEILKKRFGLIAENGETLEKIGQDYKITRERVRQIITDAIKNISKKESDEKFKEAENWLVFTIEKNHGIIREKEITKKLESKDFREKNSLKLFVQFSKKVLEVFEKGTLERSWVLSKDIIDSVKRVHLEAKDILERGKKPLADREILKKIQERVWDMEEGQILNFLAVLTEIRKNVFGKWGIKHWDEISPKGTREKIYLILKETKKPLHFTEIAILIDEYKLGKKKAHPQTVHNELIKDERFVLIGRGIYALRQWGYEEGTIKDVLKDILEKSEKPLHKNEIIAEVLKIRKVKKTTVMINLNNETIFEKKEDLYSIRK
jgi:DNA-directed RNA polymerase delta subunit